jgi:hypothetical protein
VECKERQKLSDAYFDAFRQQRQIAERLGKIRESRDEASICAAETQEKVALDELYDAWQAMNQHSCDLCR